MRTMHEKSVDAKEKPMKRKGTATSSPLSEVTGLQLLQTFESILVADEPEINFDHVGFWAHCSKLIADMIVAASHRLPISLRNVLNANEMATALLHDAARFRGVKAPVAQSALGLPA